VSIEGVRYMDGGVRSATNADLAEGIDRVLILAPTTDPGSDQQAITLGLNARVEIIAPDESSLAAFGVNPLDPAVRAPSARAGYDQGVATIDLARAVWSTSS
jgi:NTE family protein